MTLDLTCVRPDRLPMSMADLHRSIDPGDRRQVRFPRDVEPERRSDIAVGAGFTIVRGAATAVTTLERFRSLPDTVGAGMSLLVSGLNPSPAAAAAGVGFARPGNRFWPALIEAGLATHDRDPDHALHEHGIGMTDIVKRTTRRADELDAAEYEAGIERLERLVSWLQPARVCFVGLAGWRAAVDRKAIVGWQPRSLGDRPTYVMRSTSGLNASSRPADFIAHFQAVAKGPATA